MAIKEEFNEKSLIELAKNIKPVVKDKNGDLQFIAPVDISKVSFIWDPLHVKKAEGLETIGNLPTTHSYGYHGFFKPSIKEVLEQTPNYILNNKPVAFSVEFNSLGYGIHHATTTFYTGKLPQAVKRQAVIMNGKKF